MWSAEDQSKRYQEADCGCDHTPQSLLSFAWGFVADVHGLPSFRCQGFGLVRSCSATIASRSARSASGSCSFAISSGVAGGISSPRTTPLRIASNDSTTAQWVRLCLRCLLAITLHSNTVAAKRSLSAKAPNRANAPSPVVNPAVIWFVLLFSLLVDCHAAPVVRRRLPKSLGKLGGYPSK